MSEEEITDRIKDIIHTCDVGIEKHGKYDDLFAKDKEALQGILELFNKEKEENRKLRECHLRYEEMTGVDLLLGE